MLPYPMQMYTGLSFSKAVLVSEDQYPYHVIQSLDPLSIDKFMSSLPDITNAGQLETILVQLALIVKHFDETIYESVPLSFAALRDFDFLLAAANVLAPDSHKRVPDLEAILEKLGTAVDHTPRGCNFTYGLFNPSDRRMRTFTGLDEERIFIHAIQQGTRSLDDALLLLNKLSLLPIDSEEFELLTIELTRQFSSMVPATVHVLKTVTAEVFSLKIVNFFMPLNINGKTYGGITGAQVQNIGIDFIIFGIRLQEEPYMSYVRENLQAMLTFHKGIIQRTLQQLQNRSLLDKISQDIESKDKLNVLQAMKSLHALQYFLQRVLSFRMVHRRLAVKNLPLRKARSGSGGYNLSLLDELIFRTREAKRFIHEIEARLSQKI